MKLRVLMGVVAVMAMAGAASANLLTDPGFNSPAVAGNTPTDWTGSGNQGVQPWASHDGDGWLQSFPGFNGVTPGSLYQDVAGSADTTYTLDFWQAGDPGWHGSAFTVALIWLDSGLNPVGTAATMDLQPWAFVDVGWTNHVLSAVSPVDTATVRVQFDAASLGDGGAGKVDDLNLTAAVPEPATAGLVGVSLLAIMAMRRRIRA